MGDTDDDRTQRYEDAQEHLTNLAGNVSRQPRKRDHTLSGKGTKAGNAIAAKAAARAFKTNDSLKLRKREVVPVTAPLERPVSLRRDGTVTNLAETDVQRNVSAPATQVEHENVSANFRYAWVPSRDAYVKGSIDWSELTPAHENSRHDGPQPSESIFVAQASSPTTPDRIALAHIEKCVIRARREYSELCGSDDESIQDAVFRIVEQYRQLSASSRDSNGRLSATNQTTGDSSDLQDRLSDAQRELLFRSKEIEELRAQHHEETDEMRCLIEQLRREHIGHVSSHDTKLRTEQTALQEAMKELAIAYEGRLMKARDDAATRANNISGLESEIQKLKAQSKGHAEEMRKSRLELQNCSEREKCAQQVKEQTLARSNQESAQSKATVEHLERRITQLGRQIGDQLLPQIHRLQEEHKDQTRVLESKYNDQLLRQGSVVEQLKHDLAVRMELEHRMDLNVQHLLEELESQKALMRDAKMRHHAEIERHASDAKKRAHHMQQTYEDIITRMKSALPEVAELMHDLEQQTSQSVIDSRSLGKQLGDGHDASILHLRSAAESMKRELHCGPPKVLKDHHIVGRFIKIADAIERFSRIEWDVSREAKWPCKESTLLQLHPLNTRKLKQFIIQSSVWTFLYERIFRSPFRVFGLEGAQLDEIWEDIYAPAASSVDWPEMSPDAEGKRCADAKRCRTLMDPTTKISVDDSKLRESYEMVLAAAVETMARLIGKIASIGECERKSLDEIARMCAKVWMECCAQPYRLMMKLAVAEGNILTAPPTEILSLRLIRRPGLNRFGDFQGRELRSEEPVSRWESAVDTYPLQ